MSKSVLGKAVALLNAYEPGDESLSLAELHRRTGIPKTTLHRLLGELGEWKVLERTRQGYRLGMRMFEWGQLVSVQRSLCDAAAPFLACLSEATRATVWCRAAWSVRPHARCATWSPSALKSSACGRAGVRLRGGAGGGRGRGRVRGRPGP
ncbi:helix-turn-helix domain-containing protein [Streptomyces asiaticus]